MLKQTKAKTIYIYFFQILTEPSSSKHNTKFVHEKNPKHHLKKQEKRQ